MPFNTSVAKRQEREQEELRLAKAKLQALSPEQAKQLVDDMVKRNEVTGILWHAQSFLERLP